MPLLTTSTSPPTRPGRNWALLCTALVVVGCLVAAAVYFLRPGPLAVGRAGDACPAEGPAAVVGLDAETGRVQWTNIVGDSVASLRRGRSGHVVVVGQRGVRREVQVSTGRVVGCGRNIAALTRSNRPVATGADPEGGDLALRDGARYHQEPTTVPSVPTAPDGGIPAATQPPGGPTVTALDEAGHTRWRTPGRLVGASPDGVAIKLDRTSRTPLPILDFEIREPDDGTIRWTKEIWGTSAQRFQTVDRQPG